MPGIDNLPVTEDEAAATFAPLAALTSIVVAVSGGPDSVALLWLLDRWRRSQQSAPDILVVTVDHALRPEAAIEARDVETLSRTLCLEHRTMRWSDAKPSTGVPAAARQARYDLLAQAARSVRATHILTAHTCDDQAETVLMRMSRGSGIAGLGGMARETPRDGVIIARYLLDMPKARLIATLDQAGIGYATDPSNTDATYTRPRLRSLLPELAAEGCDARNLARLANRLARANDALEQLADAAIRSLDEAGAQEQGWPVAAFCKQPEEIRLRLLTRAVTAAGHEGAVELGKVEALSRCIDETLLSDTPRLRKTLAGAVISLRRGYLRIEPAPPRRHRLQIPQNAKLP